MYSRVRRRRAKVLGLRHNDVAPVVLKRGKAEEGLRKSATDKGHLGSDFESRREGGKVGFHFSATLNAGARVGHNL